MNSLKLIIAMFVVSACAVAAAKPDPQLKDVHSIFVAGNNQAAEKARDFLSKGKTCFSLATKASDADATLQIDADSKMDSGALGAFGTREWIASGTLTLKSGDLVWSHSERFGDAPFKSGGKVAGELLVRRLQRDSGCKGKK